MCFFSFYLSGKFFNFVFKGIGYDFIMLIGIRDVLILRIEFIFLYFKKLVKVSVMVLYLKLLLLLVICILCFVFVVNFVILFNDVFLNLGFVGFLLQVIINNLSDEFFLFDGSMLLSLYSGLYDIFDFLVELDYCELYFFFDFGLDDKVLRIGYWNVNYLILIKFDQIKFFFFGEFGRF